ncbi:MAG: hypothetical protein FJX47_00345 [Alphaproteobacteria bacterium]|nr:hypothetical protein [Alphaproteobacteria bacterium]
MAKAPGQLPRSPSSVTNVSRRDRSVVRRKGGGGGSPTILETAMGTKMPLSPRKPPSIIELITALEQQAQKLLDFAKTIDRQAEKRGIRDYRDLQNKVLEFDSFASLIENQLIDLKFRGKEDLRRRFDDITLLILSALIGAKLKYLKSIASRPLPIGTREVFEKELAIIQSAAEKLMDPTHRGRLSPDSIENVQGAEKILADLVARSEDLPSFG